jgi:hypothetical protein
MLSLEDVFAQLPSHPATLSDHATPTRFTASPIPGFSQHRVAKDPSGFPTLLLEVSSGIGSPSPRIVLENLQVLPNTRCRIHLPEGVEESLFTVIICTSPNLALQSLFLRSSGALVQSIGAEPSEEHITGIIYQLVELFRGLGQPPRKSVQGLWAEMLVIERARKPEILVEAWHSVPEALYDFSSGNLHLEVKSTAERLRRHYFSLQQLQLPTHFTTLIASICVERAGSGVSTQELMARIASRVAAELMVTVEQTVALTLGESWEQGLDERFDYALARQSLQYYDARLVPSVDPALPAGVTNVRFQSDLSVIYPVNLREYRPLGKLFSSLR